MLQFYSATFLKFLGTLTGQYGLVMDPHYRGGGLHSTCRGGKLMVHADKSRHPNKKLDQIINLIYFLNPDWQEEWGGHLELWNKDLTECKQRILPIANRLVFECHQTQRRCQCNRPQSGCCYERPGGLQGNQETLHCTKNYHRCSTLLRSVSP